MTNLRNVLLSLGAAVPFLTSSTTLRAEDSTNTQPVRLPPVTIYGGGYRVLPGAASTTIVEAEPVQGGALASTRDLTALTPNLAVFDGNNDRMPRFSVRGLRENNFTTGDPAVGLYLDDVPFSDLYSRSIALHDVESIEFIKGPQGTLYGASGPGGVINVVSRQPGDAWHGSAGVTYGNYDQQAYDTAISGPVISNQLAIGVSGVYSSRDGFVRNVGRKTNPDTKETFAGRVQLRFTPTENWEFTLIGAGQKFNDGFVPTFSPATGDRNYFRVARNYDGFVDTDTWNVAFKAAYTASSFKVTSISSYRNWRQNLAQDFDFSASPANSTIGLFKPQLDQWTEELRVRSLDDSAAFKWNGGLYFADNQVRTSSGRTIDIFPPLFVDRSITKSDVKGQTYAAFGEVTYTIAGKLDLTAGVRLTYDDREMSRSRSGVDVIGSTGPFALGPFTVRDQFSAAQPKFAVAYHFGPQCVLYASAAVGYQSGGFNTSNDNPAQSHFNPARSWNFETGFRTLCLDERLQFSAAFFYTDTDNYQVYRLNALNPTQAYLVNANRATSWGAEAGVTVRPVAGLTLTATGGWTESEFNSFRDPFNGVSFNGNTINMVPRFTATFAAEYHFLKHFYARGEVTGVGRYYLDEGNTVSQGAYALLNARLGYQCDHFEFYLFGRNLLDQHYAANGLDLRNAFQPTLFVRQPGDPLMWGAAITARF